MRQMLLSNGAVRKVALFKSHKVFEDAATVPCVTIFERGSMPNSIEIFNCRDFPKSAISSRIVCTIHARIRQAALTAAPWHFVSDKDLELSRRLRAMHPQLRDVALQISTGPATGRDNIFVFPAKSHPGIEKQLLFSAVRGRDIDAYRVQDPRLELLVPYEFSHDGAPKLVDLKCYPGAARYLEAHRVELETRHCVRVWRKKWYDFHDPIVFNIDSRQKIS